MVDNFHLLVVDLIMDQVLEKTVSFNDVPFLLNSLKKISRIHVSTSFLETNKFLQLQSIRQ